MNVINLGYFQEEEKQHCSYCNSNNCSQIGFVTNQLSTKVYQDLMDRGWRRCGTYYYKFNLQLSCCLAYTIRSQVLLSEWKRHQRKIAKRFLKLVNSDHLYQTNIELRKRAELFEVDQAMLSQKKQQVKGKVQAKQQIGQGQQEVKETKPQQNPNLKAEQVVPFEAEIKQAFHQFVQFLQGSREQFLKNFREYFDQKNYNFEDVLAITNLNLDLNQVKIFQSQQKKKGDFYSNFLMLIYGLNKKTLFQDFPVDKFAQQLQGFLDQNLRHEHFVFVLESTGFVTIFLKEHADVASAHITKNLKVLEKAVQRGKQNFQQLEVQAKKPKLSLITEDGFKPNLFYIGRMKVILRKAALNDEGFLLYNNYCKEIHNKTHKQSSYKSFLCQQGLKSDLLKSQIDPTQLLFLGCFHMCYYLENQLVAVGVVDITERALSSVYFFYHPALEDYNFGTFGALVEIEYVQLLSKFFPDFRYYYLGFYIQNTQKMVYKGDFEPAELLCPQTYTWVAFTPDLRKEIGLRQSNKNPKERKLGLAKDGVQVIEDMRGGDLDLYNQMKLQMQGMTMKVADLGVSERLRQYLNQAALTIGRGLMKEIQFTI